MGRKINQFFRRDLSRHDRVMDFVLVKKLQEPIELSDAHPFDQIDMLRENGIGLATKCSRYDFFYTSFSRRIGKQRRIHAVSGDNPENLRWPHWSFVTEKCSIARTQSSARRRARPLGHAAHRAPQWLAAGRVWDKLPAPLPNPAT